MNLKFKQEIMSDFFEKQHIEGLPFPAVIHHFKDADHGDPHDHPFGFHTHIIDGWYREEVYQLGKDGSHVATFTRLMVKGNSRFVPANTIHRIIEVSEGGFYSIITPEEKVQETSFYRFEDGKVFKKQWNESEFKELIIK